MRRATIQMGTVKDDQEPITWDVEAMQAGRPQPSPWSRQMMSPSQRASLDAMDEPLDALIARLVRYATTWVDGCEEPDA